MKSATGLKRSLIGFGMMLFTLASAQAFAEAGRVVYVSGEANLERAVETPLTKDAVVESGDVITTGADGRVQIRMANGEFIALRPDTRFVIDEFSMPVIPEDASTGRSFYSLLRGGFQAITNSFGARDLNSYRVHTPVATLGIRGTNFAVLMKQDGLYAGVKEGALSMSNSAGILNIEAGQVGFSGETFASPELMGNPDQAMTDLFEGVDTSVASSEAAAESGAAAGESEAASAAAGSTGGIGAGTTLLILGGIGVIAAAVSSGGSGTSSTTP